MTGQLVTLPTRRALRGALAQLDKNAASPDAIEDARALLRTIGRRFVDFADMMLGDESDPLLEPDHPVTFTDVRAMFERYKHQIPVDRLLWLNDLLTRLRQGRTPTIEDRKNLADVRGRLRTATP